MSEYPWEPNDDDDEDPFADDPFGDVPALDAQIGERKQPAEPSWTIEHGNANDPDTSPEAQGRRAAKLTLRVRRARDVQKAQFAMLDEEIADLEDQLAEAKHRRLQVDRWFLDRTNFERFQLRFWYDTAEMFQGSTQKSFALSHGLTLGSRRVPERVKWEAPVDDLLEVLPDECFDYKTTLRKAEANKQVEVRDGQLVVAATGEVVKNAVIQTTPGYTDVWITEGAGSGKISLSAVLDGGDGEDAEEAQDDGAE